MGYGHNNNSGNNGDNRKRYDSNNRNNGGFRNNNRNNDKKIIDEYYKNAETIRSPYNFVPLSKKVVFPNWADQVSHDIPFKDEDGISGKIDLEVTLKSDTYIKDSEKESDRFFKATFINKEGEPEEKFVIPGTSFKGMIRNVLEIATFGKMQNVNDDRYSIRDLSSRQLYIGRFTKKTDIGAYSAKSQAGWLTLINGKWHIIPCEYARIEQEDLERYFLETYSKNTNFGAEDEKSYKKGSTIEFKYNQIKGLEDVWFYPQREKVHKHSKVNLSYKKVIYNEEAKEKNLYNETTKNNLSAENRNRLKAGTIVFTGQPSKRVHGMSGIKHMEFIFYKEACGNPISVDDQKEDFIFINSDSNKNPLPAWEYWTRDVKKKESKQEKGDGELKEDRRVPVFYLKNSSGKVESFGLAMMYRPPYDNTIVDTIKHTNPDHSDKRRHDMAELIFGYVNSRDALRGRVQFSHFISEEGAKEAELVTTILGSPKPTYYPNYIKQLESDRLVNKLEKNGKTIYLDPKYKTFMDNDAKISGWKRYPSEDVPANKCAENNCDEKDHSAALSANMNTKISSTDSDKGKCSTTFIPLKAGAKFKGSIRFFNLKPEELGALLWALDFGGNKDCQHKIGMGKPLGFGRITIDITETLNSETSKEIDMEECLIKFRKFMDDEFKDEIYSWEKSPQIKELLAMADINRIMPEKYRGYPSLKNEETGKNDFVEYKRNSRPKRLEPYSEMIPKEAK